MNNELIEIKYTDFFSKLLRVLTSGGFYLALFIYAFPLKVMIMEIMPSFEAIRLTTILLVVCIIISFFSVLLKPSCNRKKLNFLLLWVLFLIILTVSLLYTKSVYAANDKLVQIITEGSCIVILTVLLINSREELCIFLKIIWIMSLIIGVFATLYVITTSAPVSGRELFGMDYLTYTRFILAGLIINLGYIIKNKNNTFFLVLYLGILAIMLFAVITSGAKSSVVIMLVILLMFFLLSYKISKKIFFVFLAIVLLALWVFAISGAFEDVLARFSNMLNDNNYSRTELLKMGLKVFSINPIFGMGIGSYSILTLGQDIVEYPHNIIVEIISEVGIVGILSYAACILFSLYYLIKYAIKEWWSENQYLVFIGMGMFSYMLIMLVFSSYIADNVQFIGIALPVVFLFNENKIKKYIANSKYLYAQDANNKG